MCGILLSLGRGVGARLSLDPSMIGNWEVGSVKRFLSCLNRMRVHRDKEDRVLWRD